MTTKQTAHTPGPWAVDSDQDGWFIRMEALGDKDAYLAIYASPDPEQRYYDAHLIAAAPDLLAALIELRDLVVEREQGNHDLDEELDAADAAIAKAKGD